MDIDILKPLHPDEYLTGNYNPNSRGKGKNNREYFCYNCKGKILESVFYEFGRGENAKFYCVTCKEQLFPELKI